MKQEKHEIRCSEIEKRLGKCCFFEKSYKNTRTKKENPDRGSLFWYPGGGGLEPIQMRQSGGLPLNSGSTEFTP